MRNSTIAQKTLSNFYHERTNVVHLSQQKVLPVTRLGFAWLDPITGKKAGSLYTYSANGPLDID